jgi:aryl-alcohol dehydrogenase-like predicted oxidoreductase
METRPFGRTGIRVPVLGFGAMQVGDTRVAEPEAAAMLNGVLAALRAAGLDLDAQDLDGLALRFSAYAPGVDCVIVGGADARHLEKNIAAMSAGPLRPEQLAAIRGAFNRAATSGRGLV